AHLPLCDDGPAVAGRADGTLAAAAGTDAAAGVRGPEVLHGARRDGLPRPAHPRLARPRPGRPARLFGPRLPVLGEQGLPRPAAATGPPGVDGNGGAGPGGALRRTHPDRRPQLAPSVHEL